MSFTRHKNTLRVMTWNVGFASRKKELGGSDLDRAGKTFDFIKNHKVDAIALQEMACREYDIDLPRFNMAEFFIEKDDELDSIHFEPTLSLGYRHSYPYGKLPELGDKFKIKCQETGLGIWVRNVNGWHLVNLYSDNKRHLARVEVQRPLPHPLYMGEQAAKKGEKSKKIYSAGRDEEDRPVLWSRIGGKLGGRFKNLKVYFVSLHLPTLKGEEKKPPQRNFSKTQRDVFKDVLSLRINKIKNHTVDRLASELRQYFLRHIISQVGRIEEFWGKRNRCVFIFAGDFNFYHKKTSSPKKTLEQSFLEDNGFKCVKKHGTTRPIDKKHPAPRLIDNIWVKGNDEIDVGYKKISEESELKTLSDHYPVIADIRFKI